MLAENCQTKSVCPLRNVNSGSLMELLSSQNPHRRRPRCSDTENRLFAKEYGYVGGCYECGGERIMMNEIFKRGPIVAAIDAEKGLINYSGGVFDGVSPDHARSLSPIERNSGLNGWEYTNHAIALVGFGETPDNKKFWIARNSWGRDWGRGEKVGWRLRSIIRWLLPC